MNKKLVFMGTGPFALTALQGLYESLEAGDSLAVYIACKSVTCFVSYNLNVALCAVEVSEDEGNFVVS